MSEPQTRFDSERLDARLEHVTKALEGSVQDADHLRRLATVGTVAGLIAHEFRNLMTPVRSYAQLALRRSDDAELTKKALEAAMEGADQAVAIAESLMDLIGMPPGQAGVGGGASGGISGGVGSGGQAPTGVSREWCHVEHAVRGALDSMELSLAESGVTVEIELEPGLRATIAEPDLRQVLSNLIQNAIRASDLVEGGCEVLVSARSVENGWSLAADLEDHGADGADRADGQGDGFSWHIEGAGDVARRAGDSRLVIEVSDRGCGILADSIGRVFEPFVSGAGGRGIGLATCRALVGKAQGRLGVSSGRGVGTRFVLELGQVVS
ncbi:MAG: signal transduction histidine kinase [Phycisphaerales bacterium]|jgi:signal transduction histidine kinase